MRRPWAAALLLALPLPAGAHGLWGHIHVTGWAVENMPNDELRQFLLDDPEVFNALLFGATFTDTGYAIDDPLAHDYSETAHWEPFVEACVEWMLANDPPPWDDLESKKRAAFIMGVASHGMQDSIFDSLFLSQVEERDGAGQDETDPGTDGFLALDGYIRFVPDRTLPMDMLLEVYASMGQEVTEEVIDQAVTRVTGFYINDSGGIAVAELLGSQYAPTMPWGREHYMDPAVPGSLQAEIFPTMHYQQAMWKRLHGEYSADELTVYAFPEEPRRLRSGDPAKVDSWVSLTFGEGVYTESAQLELVDDSGAAVPFTPAGTRWGANPTRLVRIEPDESLQPGAWYTARLAAGAEGIDGMVTTEPWERRFQVECEGEGDPDCPDLGEIAVASTDGMSEDSDDTGDADTGSPAAGDREGGCGCASTAPTSGWWLAGLPGLVGLARRRR